VSKAFTAPKAPRDECAGCGNVNGHSTGCAYLPDPDRYQPDVPALPLPRDPAPSQEYNLLDDNGGTPMPPAPLPPADDWRARYVPVQ
jgi:hypothetical protein